MVCLTLRMRGYLTTIVPFDSGGPKTTGGGGGFIVTASEHWGNLLRIFASRCRECCKMLNLPQQRGVLNLYAGCKELSMLSSRGVEL